MSSGASAMGRSAALSSGDLCLWDCQERCGGFCQRRCSLHGPRRRWRCVPRSGLQRRAGALEDILSCHMWLGGERWLNEGGGGVRSGGRDASGCWSSTAAGARVGRG